MSADQDAEIDQRLGDVQRQLSTSSNAGRSSQSRSSNPEHNREDDADYDGESPIKARERGSLESSFFTERDSTHVFTNMQRALQHQKPIFSLDFGIITVEAAQRFLQQANVMGNTLEIGQVMSEEAMDTFDLRIITDMRQTLLSQEDVPR